MKDEVRSFPKHPKFGGSELYSSSYLDFSAAPPKILTCVKSLLMWLLMGMSSKDFTKESVSCADQVKNFGNAALK